MIDDFLARTADAGVALAGSVIAVPSARRAAFAEFLDRHGLWVHADVIDGAYRGQPGVTADELAGFVQTVGTRLDVHLMVDDPAAALAGLPGRVARVTVQIDELGDNITSLVRSGRDLADEVWLAIHAAEPDPWLRVTRAGADGLLVMLTPPGRPRHRADLGRLSAVRGASTHRVLVGIDGGARTDNLDAIITAGARYIVAGRALLPSPGIRT
jgi:pentose-5-phosphate-3-epimerase